MKEKMSETLKIHVRVMDWDSFCRFIQPLVSLACRVFTDVVYVVGQNVKISLNYRFNEYNLAL